MKKGLFILLIAAFACAHMAAQEAESAQAPRGFTVAIESAMDLFYSRSFGGDYASKTAGAEGSVYQYQGTGTYNVFQPSFFDDRMLGAAAFKYAGQKLGGTLQFRSRLIKEVYNSTTQDRLSVDIGDWEAWTKFAFGSAGGLRLLLGNTAQRGGADAAAAFGGFDDFLKVSNSNFGVLIPTWKRTPEKINADVLDSSPFPYGYESSGGASMGYATFASIDGNDLFMPPGPNISSDPDKTNLLNTWFGTGSRRLLNLLVDGTVNIGTVPLTVSFATGGFLDSIGYPFDSPWYAEDKVGIPMYDSDYPELDVIRRQLAGRIQAEKILDMLSVAGTFKYLSSQMAKPEAKAGMQDEINELIKDVAFGAYVNLNLAKQVPGLGFTLGYSGYHRTWINSLASKNTVLPAKNVNMELWHWNSYFLETYYPFYHGVDFQAQYKGIPNLELTLNNNFSFSKINGAGKNGFRKVTGGYKVVAWAYAEQLNENGIADDVMAERSESYFGLSNALNVKYTLSDMLALTLQVGNQAGFFSLDWEHDPAKSVTDVLGIYLGATLNIVENRFCKATLRSGLDAKISFYNTQEINNPTVYKANYMDFGIPLGLRVEF